MRLSPGDLFAGKYRIEALLREGGMGAVYVAVNERLHKRVALKVISERLGTSAQHVERFTQEAIAASRVPHPGVVEIFDADIHQGAPWIAMELLEGESLGDRLRRGPIPVAEATEVARAMLDALAAVHAAGIVHRDLKPDNVFCCNDGRVKLLDFGIAKLAVDEITGQTETGVALGTPFYLAPEQASSAKDVGPRADLYSVGVVLYEMVSGARPYEATGLGDLVRQMYTSGPVRLAQRAAHLPPALTSVVDRCLSVDPNARPASAREVMDALAQVTTSGFAATAALPAAGTPATMALDSSQLQAAISASSPGAGFGGAQPPAHGGFGAPAQPAAGGFGAPAQIPPMAQTAQAVAPVRESSGSSLGLWIGGCLMAVLAIPCLAGVGFGAWSIAARDDADTPPPVSEEVELAVSTLAPMAGADVERVRIDASDAPALGGAEPLVTVVMFSDFQCPYCRRVDPTLDRIRDTYGDRVRLVYRHHPLPMHGQAMPAAQVAHEAYVQGGDPMFWRLHDVLFENQGSLERADLERYAAQVGVDLGRLRTALDTARHAPRIQRDVDAASAAGARGTPNFFINGRYLGGAQPYEAFQVVIEEEIALAEAMMERGVSRRSLYANFQRGAVARRSDEPAPSAAADAPTRAGRPDPEATYRVPLGDSPGRGGREPLVTIVSFSEFQCPFCSRVVPTLETLLERYGADLRLVFKHNPLAFHQNAMPAAELAVEAQQQGRFWPVHDALFENQRNLDRATLLRIAGAAGMDVSRARAALDDHRHRSRVTQDQQLAAQLGSRGTPGFFINGRYLAGAQPVERFAAVIDQEMIRARAMIAAGTPRSGVYDAVTRNGLTRVGAAAPTPSAPSGGDEIERHTLAVPSDAPSRGPATAALTIQIFSDFQCPFCSRVAPTVDRIVEHYGPRVRVVWRHYPLPFHQRAMPAAIAAQSVYEQAGDEAFWRYHDVLFENQRSLEDDDQLRYAGRVRGVSRRRVEAALESPAARARIERDMAAVRGAGMRIGTPSFLIGTRQLSGAQPFERFREVIDAELAAR